jgi:hypothetical protein
MHVGWLRVHGLGSSAVHRALHACAKVGVSMGRQGEAESVHDKVTAMQDAVAGPWRQGRIPL